MEKIIVIGAGILGTSTAYHLAKSGVDVTVIDRNDIGQATDAAAGIVCPWISQRRNKRWYSLVKGGAKFYPSLINELEKLGESETGYKRVGAISLHKEQEKLEKMAERALKRREEAPEIGEVKILTPTETKKLFPVVNEDYGSVYVSGGARVNGRALRDALINCARHYGARFYHGNASIECKNNSIVGVSVGDETYTASKVVLTTGSWSKELLTPLGIDFQVTPQKAQIIHLSTENQDTENWPVVMPPNNQYLLSFDDGRVVIGATHEDDAGFDNRVTAGGMNEILGKALEMAPGLSQSTYVETRVGFRPYTPGFLPIYGEVPGFQNLFIANGLGASGLTSGPYLGAEMAKLIMGHQTELNPNDYPVGEAICLLKK